jgi:hypothetical protein
MSLHNGSRDQVKAQLRDAAEDAEQIAEIGNRLRELAAALMSCGLKVVIRAPAMTVSNPAASDTDSPRGKHLNPGLSQSVLLRQAEEGLTWCWVWPAFRSAERGAPTPPPEVEPICAAADIEQAAARIANVLRVGGAQAGVCGGYMEAAVYGNRANHRGSVQ